MKDDIVKTTGEDSTSGEELFIKKFIICLALHDDNMSIKAKNFST